MTKYTRFRAPVLTLIKQVFSVSGISMDTKLIILVMAACMPRYQFRRWLDSIQELNAFNTHFRQLNAMRHMFGIDCRNFILLIVMQHAQSTVSDAELQQFIANKGNRVRVDINDQDQAITASKSATCLFYKHKTHS